MITHPPGISPIKGRKSVATRVVRGLRKFLDWRGRVEWIEVRHVAYSLHPTKGWRKVGASEWRKAR
jgi:hypothetical protein